jgi:hypothetical protein
MAGARCHSITAAQLILLYMDSVWNLLYSIFGLYGFATFLQQILSFFWTGRNSMFEPFSYINPEFTYMFAI